MPLKLEDAVVESIIRRYMDGEFESDLAAETGVARSTISRILQGTTYPHIWAKFPTLRKRTGREVRLLAIKKNPESTGALNNVSIWRDARRYRELKALGLLDQLGIIDED